MTKHRKKVSNHSDIDNALLSDQQHVWHHLTQHKGLEQSPPIMITSGKGMRIKDTNNKEYLDAVSGAVWTVNVGYGRERIAKAVYDQLIKMNYIAGSMGNIPAANFSEMLTEIMPGMSRVY
jgi:taurine-pyruvate aminotransferase